MNDYELKLEQRRERLERRREQRLARNREMRAANKARLEKLKNLPKRFYLTTERMDGTKS